MGNKTDLSICFVILAISPVVAALSFAGHIIYVDADATGTNDGSSWADAYNYLQDALADANSAPKPVQIRVAQGIYKPDRGAGITPGDREATFQLINGVSLKGGYAGFGEPDPNVRDIGLYETILSGDLDANDLDVSDINDFWDFWWWDEPSRAENSYHVLTGSSTDETAILDGFTIASGYADGAKSENQDQGGGMYTASGEPTVTNCAFIGNSAIYGGGMYNSSSKPRLVDCSFEENRAVHGGGIYNSTSDASVVNCSFSGNYAGLLSGGGGGIYNDQSSPTITNCTFINNRANKGGGICDRDSSTTVANCTFRANRADYFGGAISCEDKSASTIKNNLVEANWANEGGGIRCRGGSPIIQGNVIKGNKVALGAIGFQGLGGGMSFRGNSAATITHNVITNNSAIGTGGAIFSDLSTLTLFNNIITGNEASDEPRGMGRGGGIYSGRSSVTIINNTISGNRAYWQGTLVEGGGIQISGSVNLLIVNSILWSNEPDEIHYRGEPKVEAAYCDIQGGWPGEGNIDADPCFAEPGYWDPNGTAYDVDDDFWVEGDYHLKSQAGRWDPNIQAWVQDDVTSPCIDAGDMASPIGFEPFPNGGIINMGAYGGTAEASKSYFDEPVCETIVAGDINGDCIIDFKDFCLLGLHWLTDNNP